MNQIYLRTGITLAGFGACSAIAGLIGGAAWGWAIFALSAVGMLAWHAWHLSLLASWVANPAKAPVPEGHGAWDEILAVLHRHERAGARREAMLAEALTRFRLAAQAMPDGVVILERETRIEWCNDMAATQLGLDPRTDVGQPIANLVREPAFIEYLAAEDHLKLPPLRVPFGGAIYALQLIPYGEKQKLLLVRDVTQADRLETMRRDFVANVSHELRTPLTVLVGFLETIRELKLDPQRTRDYLGMMQEQSARMHRIIEDLLTLSVLESAPPPPSDRIRVKPLLERVRADGEALSGGRHAISLRALPAVDVLGSEAELASAFGNLVTNAIRYTPQGGAINIVWRDGPESCSFSVEDTGIGIAPDHLPRLTERFYRVDRSRSRETGGTGLGLAIVKHAVARHQATLEIDSKPGAGSRFTIRFPAKRTVPADPSAVRDTREVP